LKILLTNDDGILAPGIRTLASALRESHDVTLVAPDREQSASSHSITLDRPLRIRDLGDDTFTVDGTPTDCVLVGCKAVLDGYPDLVVSGLNHGPNMGEDVTYSGTVAAAFEAHILGIPSIAGSVRDRENGDYEGAARIVADLANCRDQWATRPVILNVNFPLGPSAEWGPARVTRLGTRIYPDEIIEKEDPRGKKYYWIGGKEPTWEGGEDTDFATVYAGAVSVTPLHLDLTDESARDALIAAELCGVGS
jgi:5'-nucleotidase